MAGRYRRRTVNLPEHLVEYVDRLWRGQIAGVQPNPLGIRGRDEFARVAVALLAAALPSDDESESILDRVLRLVSLLEQEEQG